MQCKGIFLNQTQTQDRGETDIGGGNQEQSVGMKGIHWSEGDSGGSR